VICFLLIKELTVFGRECRGSSGVRDRFNTPRWSWEKTEEAAKHEGLRIMWRKLWDPQVAEIKSK